MWNLPKGKEFLLTVSLKQLEKLHADEAKVKPKMRLLVAICRKKAQSIDEIANNLNLPRNTVYNYLKRFIQRGISAKDSVKQSGRPPVLTKKQRQRFIKDLERGPPNNPRGLWSTKEVRDLLKKKYKVSFVHQHVWRILTQCGFSLQRPRKRHYKAATPAEMQEFKKKLNEKQLIIERKVSS
jgi:transposase